MYVFCLFMRVLLSWFPGIDWNAQPWTFLRLVSGSSSDSSGYMAAAQLVAAVAAAAVLPTPAQ
jgi:hypothetical protein